MLCTANLLMTMLGGGMVNVAYAASPAPMSSAAATIPASVSQQKKVITHDVYANWRSIQNEILSRDGQWVAYALVAQEADGEIVFRRISDAHEWRVARGVAPVFSADGHFAAFSIKPTQRELEQAKKAKKKADEMPKSGVGMIDLQTGAVQRIDHVRQFAWPEEGGNTLAVLMEPAGVSKNNSATYSATQSVIHSVAQSGAGTQTSLQPQSVIKKTAAGAHDNANDRSLIQIETSNNMVAADATGAAGMDGAMDVAIDSADQSISVADSKKKIHAGELILIDAVQNLRLTFQNVTEFIWAKNGNRLSFIVSNQKTDQAEQTALKSGKSSDAKKAADVGKEVVPSVPPTSTSTSPTTPVSAAAAMHLADGVYLLTSVSTSISSSPVAVMTGAGHYKNLRFDEAGTQLAFISNREQLAANNAQQSPSATNVQSAPDSDATTKKETVASREKNKPADLMDAYYWNEHQLQASALVTRRTAGMPAGWGVSEYGDVSFSKDGQRLFLGTAPTPKEETNDAPDPMKVDLWHWQDPELQSMQKVKAEKEKQRSYKAVVHLATQRLVQLATPQIPQVFVNDNAEFSMGISDVPYQMLQSWDALYRDAYAVNLNTGEARLLIKKSRFLPGLSPAGKYLFAFDAGSSQWLAWSTKEGTRLNLTAHLRSSFFDHEQDTPEPRSAYGYAGWTEADQHFIVYDQFDVWEVNPQTHSGRMLTEGYGRQHQLQLRYVDVLNDKKIPKEDDVPVVDMKALPQGRWLLQATHQQDRSTGLYQQESGGGLPRRLLYAEKLFGNISKAKQADTLLFTRQSFTEFPDLWVSDLQLQTPQKISHANPQQSQYNWGTQELISYTSADGKKLKALLAKPENFDPSKKYPMMVYIYEKMSDNLHRYVPPAPSQNINVTRYLSNGYVVLRPDIVYQTGHPGKSAMKAVIPAVNKVLSLSYVDPARVGIQGHSWGAYQINYMITQTKMFRAAEAGASMANMISGYGGIRWGKGMSRAFQYETGQSRLGGTPWNKTAEFIENSPIFYVDKVQTPYLTKHNDDDDAVPWYQAIEFFTAMRRLGKEAYWFNYNGEKHGLKDRDHVKHYTVHMAEFFDHFLLGQPRPEWMIRPIPYLERGKRDVMGLFVPAAATSAPEAIAETPK